MLRIIRSGYWIPKLKNPVSTEINECLPRTRFKNRQTIQFMTALSPERTQINKKFTNVGVDFARPFDIKVYNGRITKGYVCVFVCSKSCPLESYVLFGNPSLCGNICTIFFLGADTLSLFTRIMEQISLELANIEERATEIH